MSSRLIVSDISFFFRKTPFFRLLLALMGGIAFQTTIGYSLWVFLLFFWLGIAMMLGGYFYGNRYRLRWIFGVGVLFWLFSLGLFLTQKADESTQFRYINESHTYLAKVVSPPRERARSVAYELRLIKNIDNGSRLHSKVLVYLATDSLSLSREIGERIIICTAFQKPQRFGNPYEFDYPQFLKRKGISATSFIPADNWQILDEKPPFSIRNLAMKARNHLLSIYQELGISGNEFGVLAALTLGYREDLSQDLRASYQAAGVAHVLAVSGMHVGIIFIVLDFMLGFMNRKRSTRIAKTVIIVLFLVFYSFITGMPPSVIRSAMMLSIVTISKTVSQKTDTYNTVFLCAFFMLLYNPYYLFDIGFQMSYLAVLGIVFYQSKFENLWRTRNKVWKPLWSLFTVSLAAQLVTTPLSLYYFNYFPNYFWITNIVIVPMVSWIIYLACGLFLVYQIPFVNDLVATLLSFVLRVTNEIIVFFHHLPFSQIENIWLDGWQLAAISVVIIVWTVAAIYRHGKSFVVGLLLITVLFSVHSYTKHQTVTSGNRMFVAALQEGHAVTFINGASSYLLTNSELSVYRSISPYLMKNRINQPVLINQSTLWGSDDGFVAFGGKRMLVLTENIFEGKITDKPLELDYLILTSNLRISMAELTRFVSPAKIIIDQSYRPWVSNRIVRDAERMGIACWVVGKHGAYVVKW